MGLPNLISIFIIRAYAKKSVIKSQIFPVKYSAPKKPAFHNIRHEKLVFILFIYMIRVLKGIIFIN